MQIAPEFFSVFWVPSAPTWNRNSGFIFHEHRPNQATWLKNEILCSFSAECCGWLWWCLVWWGLASWSITYGPAMWTLKLEPAWRLIITRHGACPSRPSPSATSIVYSGPRQKLWCRNCESWVFVYSQIAAPYNTLMAIFLLLTVVVLSFKDEDPVASSVRLKFSFVKTVLHLPLFLCTNIQNSRYDFLPSFHVEPVV